MTQNLSNDIGPLQLFGLSKINPTFAHTQRTHPNKIIQIYWLDSKRMSSYVVPHQPRGAQRQRTSI